MMGGHDGAVSEFADRVPATVQQRGGLRELSVRGPLARRLRLPGLSWRAGVDAEDQGGHLRMRVVRSPDVGNGGHRPAASVLQ